MLTLFLYGEFLLYIPCCLHFYAGSFSYTSRAILIFMQGVSLTHRVLASFFLFFIWGVSLTHPVLVYFLLLREFLLHLLCWLPFYPKSFSYTSKAGLIFVWGVSFTHPVLALFLSGEFSYTPRVGFNLISGLSLTDPISFLSG